MDSQKVVTFYRESDSEEPELRIIIDGRKYANLQMLADELRRILNLRDHERNIYNQTGRLLRRIEDFEDGGSYFFSFSINDKRFMQALSVVNNDVQVSIYSFFSNFNSRIFILLTNLKLRSISYTKYLI